MPLATIPTKWVSIQDTPLHKLDDDAIKNAGMKRFKESDDVDWLTPDADKMSEEFKSNVN
jgi:hypothetical protein